MTSDETRMLVAWLRVQLKQFAADLDWSPSDTVAQEYREHLAQAAAELEATLPEEKVGRCWCEPGDRVTSPRNYQVAVPEMTYDEALGWRPRGVDGRWYWTYCEHCGAELCSDGIARRNADAGRVARVRDLVADGEAAYPLTIWPEPTQVDPGSDLAKHGERCAAAMARRVYARIRSALDGPAPTNQIADAAAAQDAWRAKQPGYRDDQPGVPEPTPEQVGSALRVGAKDTARLDVLSDLVRQSSERGECVVIDGRGSRTTVEWWPETASDEAPMNMTCGGTDLREALDRAKDGELDG